MNDGDIKVIANKFYWKYVRPDKVSLIKSLYGKFQSIASTSNTTFWWELQTQTEWVSQNQPEHTIWVPRHKTLRTQYLPLGVFFRKQYIILASYKELQNAKFLFIYSFTILLFRHLPTEIGIFINVCFQMKCFHGDRFSFF